MPTVRPFRLLSVLLSLALLVAGCSSPKSSQHEFHLKHDGPIREELALLLPSGDETLLTLDLAQKQLVQEIELGRSATQHVETPDGKIAIPLTDRPRDSHSYVAFIDRQTGVVNKVVVPSTGLDLTASLPDGTMFIRTGTSYRDKGFLNIIVDAKQEKFVREVWLPGPSDTAEPWTDDSFLVPVQSGTGVGGNIWVVYSDPNRQPEPLLPGSLEPWAPGQIIFQPGTNLAYFAYSGFGPGDEDVRKERAPLMKDPHTMDSHIAVWDLAKKELVRRIYLHLPSAQWAVLGPTGLLYVSHTSMNLEKVKIDQISIVNPQTGEVREQKTVPNPIGVQIKGDHLIVSADRDPELEIFHLPDMTSEGVVKLPHPVWLTPRTYPR